MTADPVRKAVVIGLLVLGGAQVVRNLAVSLPRDQRPALLAASWPSHPRLAGEAAMARIGEKARTGEAPGAETLAEAASLARHAPLDPQPYLIAGAIAEKAGKGASAEALFVMARTRDPRAPAARYFLANRYLKSGRAGPALDELAATARLLPNTASMVPAFAAFAATTGDTATLGSFLRRNPEYRDTVLDQLAREAANAQLVLKLAGPGRRGAAPSPDWRAQMVATLIAAGRYADARDAWQRLSGEGLGNSIYNPVFAPTGAPAPFNWRFENGTAGLVEPRGNGRLEIVYYGRADAALASQMMVLAPAVYRLGATVAATASQTGLSWIVTCLPGNNAIARLPLDRKGAGRVEATFAVPANCGAQRLDLAGSSKEAERTSEVTLSNLSLQGIGR